MMEDRTESLINFVPSFARGTDILLVHNDTLSLGYLASVLRQYSFKVTATNKASAAVSKIYEQESRFKLVMAKANMPDMSTLAFLHMLRGREIPVIFIFSGEYGDLTSEALAKGLCYFIDEPIQPQDLKYVWQHVYHTKKNLVNEIQNARCKEKVHGASENRTVGDMHKDKRAKHSSDQMNFDSNNHTVEEEGEERRERNNSGYSDQKKPRIVWTPKLHRKFVAALSVLGVNNIRPKAIQQVMNVPDLTCRQIASHLQKFKSQVNHIQENITDLPPVKPLIFSGRTKLSSSLESQSYPGFPASNGFLNENQLNQLLYTNQPNQNQFPRNFAETQGPEILLRQKNPDYSTLRYELPTELENYGSQNLDAVARGPVQDALINQNQNLIAYNNILKLLGEDSDKYDYFGNGSRSDDIAQDSEILRNSGLGNSSNPQQSDKCNPSCVRLLKDKPSAVVGEPSPDAVMDQNQTQTEYNNILQMFGEDSDKYYSFGNGSTPDDIAQDSQNIRNSIIGNSSSLKQSENYNPNCARLLKAKPCAVVRGPVPDVSVDQDKTLTEYNILKFLGEDYDEYDSFGNGSTSDDIALDSEILRNSIHGNSSSPKQSDTCSPSCTRLLKAKSCVVVGRTVPDVSMYQNHNLKEYNISQIFGDDCDEYLSFGNGSTPDDITQDSEILRNSILGNSSGPQQSDNCNPSCVRILKTKPCVVVGRTVPDVSMDQNHDLKEYNISKIFGEDSDKYDSFGNGSTPDNIAQDSEIPGNSILGNSSCPKQFDNWNPSCARILKAKPCVVERGEVPDVSMDQDQILTEYNILKFLGEDYDKDYSFGNGSTSNYIAQDS